MRENAAEKARERAAGLLQRSQDRLFASSPPRSTKVTVLLWGGASRLSGEKDEDYAQALSQ